MNSENKKTIWIIGASSGIGRSLAIILAQKGHRLVISGRRIEHLESLKNQFIPEALIVQMDITYYDAFKQGLVDIEKYSFSVDSIILMSADYEPMGIDNLNIERCRSIINTNLISAFYILETVVPTFKSRGQGQIIFCGSLAGYRGLPNGQPYSASKSALINLAESARAELSYFGIDIKIINPGFVKTEMTDKNSFSMPMIISADLAAERIAKQIFDRNKFEIKTHYIFSILMSLLKFIPYSLYFRIVRKKI